MEEKRKDEWFTFQFCERHTPHDFRDSRQRLLEQDQQLRYYFHHGQNGDGGEDLHLVGKLLL